MNFDSLLQGIPNSNVISLVLQGLILYLAILWIASIIWVTKDASNRSHNILFQVISILLAIIPFLGLPVYLAIRPSKTITEQYWEQMQLQVLNEELAREKAERKAREYEQDKERKKAKMKRKEPKEEPAPEPEPESENTENIN